ncbi:hypothetical protein J4E83_000801 [Alternaria metachromatica]|uniref:uncharacterized protein n=1 Tax=Alternaria metachromatica TaxID=283354 RepID=UPI0020C3DE21|nr:uncharacterized protein J4E83_000801 [Alternaria metachromatica]KAI4637980.1 hypothetical protein J4E83_000801 [Alternaria metachromatica]
MDSVPTSSQVSPEADERKTPINDIVYYSSSRYSAQYGSTNCELLRRILHVIPASWRYGRAVNLLDPGINLQDVYGSEEFRTKLGLGDWDASGKDKWVTTDLVLEVWKEKLNDFANDIIAGKVELKSEFDIVPEEDHSFIGPRSYGTRMISEDVKDAYENAPKESRKRDQRRRKAKKKIRFLNSIVPFNESD